MFVALKPSGLPQPSTLETIVRIGFVCFGVYPM